jgi:uncharacterized protein (TIGR00645 family)
MNTKLLKKIIQFPIFESRWILMVFYLGLIVAQVGYCAKFCEKVFEVFNNFRGASESDFLLIVLNLLDMVMIANLIKMIISGSYQTFIEKLDNDHSEKVSSGALKIKMASSLVGVSAINLLQTFINTAHVTIQEVVLKGSIHLLFLVSAIGLAFIEYLHEKGRTLDKESAH